MDKQELVQYFQDLDLATLQKLQKYSQQIIIPDEDLLVNVTMSQMITKAHQLADVLFPEWTDRSKSDFGEFLVELFAVFSEKDFWYINAYAGEGILRKMRSYSNAYVQAVTMGYSPTLLKGSTSAFAVMFASGEEYTYKKGDLKVGVGSVIFTNDSEFVVPASVIPTGITLELHQGEQNREDYLFNGFCVYVRRDGIDINSVSVIIDNITYTRVNNFGMSGSTSTHFMVLPEEDGSVSIFFGDNVFGVTPPIGKNVQVLYRKCIGTDGNIAVASSTISESHPTRLALSSNMVIPATGGTNQESLASIKAKAPLYFSVKKAIINEAAAESVLNSFSFIRRSKVTVNNRYLIYQAIPVSGDPNLSEEELAVLVTDFSPYLMSGFEASYQENTYRNLITSANPDATHLILEVLAYRGYDVIVIESTIRQLLADLTNPLINAEYGGSFNRSNVDIKIRMASKGVQGTVFKLNVGGLEMSMPDVTLSAQDIFATIDQTKVMIRINVN